MEDLRDNDVASISTSGNGFYLAHRDLFEFDKFTTAREQSDMTNYLQRSFAVKPGLLDILGGSPPRRSSHLDTLSSVFNPDMNRFRTLGNNYVAQQVLTSPSRLDPISDVEMFQRKYQEEGAHHPHKYAGHIDHIIKHKPNYRHKRQQGGAGDPMQYGFHHPSPTRHHQPAMEQTDMYQPNPVNLDRFTSPSEGENFNHYPRNEIDNNQFDQQQHFSNTVEQTIPQRHYENYNQPETASHAAGTYQKRFGNQKQQHEYSLIPGYDAGPKQTDKQPRRVRKSANNKHVSKSNFSLRWDTEHNYQNRWGKKQFFKPEIAVGEEMETTNDGLSHLHQYEFNGGGNENIHQVSLPAGGGVQDKLGESYKSRLAKHGKLLFQNAVAERVDKKDHLWGTFKTGSKVEVGFFNDNTSTRKPIFDASAFPEYNPLERQKTPPADRGALYRKFQLWTKRRNNNFSHAKDIPSPIKRRIDAFANLEKRRNMLKAVLKKDLEQPASTRKQYLGYEFL
eukprot:g3544.t1